MMEDFVPVVDMKAADLRDYLSSVIDDFNPSAETPLGLQGYVEKLVRNGRVIAAISTTSPEVVAGIIAGYFNNPTQGFSFVSAFHVRIPFRRMRLGRMLMDEVVNISRGIGFEEVRLKVDKLNGVGIAFYERYGFFKMSEDDRQFEMAYSLKR